MRLASFVFALPLAACAGSSDPATDPAAGGDLPLGDVEGDTKADGASWGSALDCKSIPDLPALVSPQITVSLDGLTLHLVDTATGFDKVFPIGPGRVDTEDTDPELGESLSYRPIIDHRTNDFSITPASSVACKTWWTDPDTGEKSPVFAGLPFMSWSGNYAIHGPIDNFRATNGGTLRRGFVSHGCVRMEAADILEVYARVHTVARVPVHVQRAPERANDGAVVDIPNRWVGDACEQDSDCNFTNGFCAQNPVSHAGFCSAHCTQYCADKAASPPTFCVAEPANAGQGMCVAKAIDQNYECRPYDHMTATTAPRVHQPTVTANVCMPHSPGWIGDHCLADADCSMGMACRGATTQVAGTCTMDCTAICPDQPGWASTFCARSPALSSTAGACVRACTPSSHGAECPGDLQCAALPRAAQTSQMRFACVAQTATTL